MSDLLKPNATLLQGMVGTGKTDVLVTWVTEAERELFIIATEATGIESILDSAKRRKADLSKIHWMLIKPSNMDLRAMVRSADQINSKSVADLQKIDSPGTLDKKSHRKYIDFLEACNKFIDARTGKEYGSVADWGPDYAFCVDGLTGLNKMVTKLQVGNRGTLTLPDYNVIQLTLQEVIDTLTGLNCFFTLTAHVEFEKNEITSKQQVSVSTVGQKLAPKVPIEFSEVIKCYKEGNAFWWSTQDSDWNLKSRALPLMEKIRPGFGQVYDAWTNRSKLLADDVKEVKPATA